MAMRVFVTGASTGLGRALSLHYARRGATLGLVARRREALETVASEAPGGPHATYAADVADREAMTRAAREFAEQFGLPDIVVANAGISVGTLIEHAEDVDACARVFEVNVMGVINALHPFVAPMRARGRGRLVGIASVSGIRGLPGAGAYCASKAALITLLESLRAELHGSGVHVTTICPGYIETRMTASNPYRMPFILSAEEAARRVARTIERGSSYAVIPWQMAVVAKALRLLPNGLFDRLFARAARKPRGLPP